MAKWEVETSGGRKSVVEADTFSAEPQGLQFTSAAGPVAFFSYPANAVPAAEPEPPAEPVAAFENVEQ